MDPVTAPPAHLLLQRKRSDDHRARPEGQGPADAFASYMFGPLDMPDGRKADTSGTAPLGNPLKAHSLSWITTVQAAGPKTG